MMETTPLSSTHSKIIIFDTTMRDGELAPGFKLNIHQKLHLAKILEEMRVDVIEVGYPGAFRKDFDELFMISKQIKHSSICGLAGSQPDEIASVALAIKPAVQGRIHIYTPVNLTNRSPLHQAQTLETIQDSITLARDYCTDVEWSAFDATRSDPDFLCKAIEIAIKSGATTIGIPDSSGMAEPDEFAALLATITNRVPNIERVTIAVHCHDDLGFAVENSLVALEQGARQIECSINGIGARRGNANLEDIAMTLLAKQQREHFNPNTFTVDIETSLLPIASQFINEIIETAVF